MTIAEELLFSEWRIADRQARLLEQAIAAAALAAAHGGQPPSAEQMEAAHRLRGMANDLFKVAMAEMADRAASLRPTQHG